MKLYTIIWYFKLKICNTFDTIAFRQMLASVLDKVLAIIFKRYSFVNRTSLYKYLSI